MADKKIDELNIEGKENSQHISPCQREFPMHGTKGYFLVFVHVA